MHQKRFIGTTSINQTIDCNQTVISKNGQISCDFAMAFMIEQIGYYVISTTCSWILSKHCDRQFLGCFIAFRKEMLKLNFNSDALILWSSVLLLKWLIKKNARYSRKRKCKQSLSWA